MELRARARVVSFALLALASLRPGLGEPPARAQIASGRPWLGVSMEKDGSALAPGVLVAHVVHGSPADRCGLRAGDRIVRIGGTSVSTGQALVAAVGAHSVGETLEVAYVRDNHETRGVARLSAYPSADDVLRMDLVGQPAPAWGSVTFLTGSVRHGLSEVRGRVVVLDFWATWCVPCRIVTPKLSQLEARHGAEGLTVVGLSADEATAVASYVAKEHPRYAIGVDVDAETSRSYGVVSLPTVVVIDRQGTVRDVFVGYDPVEESRMETTVVSLLAERPPGP